MGVLESDAALALTVVVGAAGSVVIVRLIDRTSNWGARRRARLLLGLPWGTFVSIAFVLFVYLVVQGGWRHFNDPVSIAFRSWSYFYPPGVAFAGFAHRGPNHLIGNLLATIVFGTLAEYAWGHFPQARGTTSFSRVTTNPYARAFLVFPAAVVTAGVTTSLFSWGPVIGFSGVVFAFVGFAFARYPVGTVVALGAEEVVGVVFRALRDPVVESVAKPVFSTPWWVGIAVQGHLLGLFLGLIAGAYAFRNRLPPAAHRVWGAAVIVTVSLSLWAVWWFRGNAEFVLHRGLGVLFVLALSLLISIAIKSRSTDREIRGVPARHTGFALIMLPILVVAFVAVPLNLTAVASADSASGPTIETNGYTVRYAENVTNQLASVVNLSILGETTVVRASGVIVTSPVRQIWQNVVPKSRLKFTGTTTITVGGLGWRETVTARRIGWSVAGNASVYRVWLRTDDKGWRLAYLSDPQTADPVINGRRVALAPTPGGVVLEVRSNASTLDRAPIPGGRTASVRAGGLTFVRENRTVYARHNDTRVTVATRERYR